MTTPRIATVNSPNLRAYCHRPDLAASDPCYLWAQLDNSQRTWERFAKGTVLLWHPAVPYWSAELSKTAKSSSHYFISRVPLFDAPYIFGPNKYAADSFGRPKLSIHEWPQLPLPSRDTIPLRNKLLEPSEPGEAVGELIESGPALRLVNCVRQHVTRQAQQLTPTQ
jgi:hypothetical protein